jgi:hypothetical protein
VVRTPPELPSDRVLSGTVRNDALREKIAIAADDVRLLDARGREVRGAVGFLGAFVHGLATPDRPHVAPGLSELARTGRIVVLRPGQTAPLAASWTVTDTSRRPVRLDYGPGSLALPE